MTGGEKVRPAMTRRAWAWAAVVAIGCLARTQAAMAGEVPWQSGPAAIANPERGVLADAIAELAGRAGQRHLVVQFDRAITAAQREQVNQSGVTLLNFVGNHTYFASFSDGGVDAAALGAMPVLIGVQGIERAWKLHPRVLAGDVPSYAAVGQNATGETIVGLYILFHPDVDLLTDAVGTVQAYGGQVRDELESINALVVEMPLPSVELLADEDVVQWIEWPLPPMDVVNDSNRAITEADIAQAPPYNLDGSGVTVLVYDAGTARPSHVDFGGRLTVHDGSGMHYHSTHVAGTIGGDGTASGGLYRGMAPGVTMLSYGFEWDESGVFLYDNPGDLEDDYDEAINVRGADIANNSIGTNTALYWDCDITGDYGVTAQLIDTIVRGDGSNLAFDEPFLVIWANGNERQTTRCGDTYYTTAPPAGAKNHITVGALNSNDDSMTYFSSWGPVDDGRLKPDITAPGCQSGGDGGVTSTWDSSDTAYGTICGTSMACPTVTGLASLLIEDFRAHYPALPLFRNSTLKAWLAHTAVDRGNTGPDNQFGYGSVRVRQAVDFMRTGQFMENSVSQGGTFSRTVVISPGDSELKVTLAWDDVPAAPNATACLVNDLDLRLYSPSMTRAYPWTLDPGSPAAPATRDEEDHINNIEQVLVNNPAPGTWTIQVYGYDVPQGPQSFSLVGDGAYTATIGMTVTPATDLVSEGPSGGPFAPGSIAYTLGNVGPDPIGYNVTKSQSWVTITNGSGTLAGSGGTAVVTVSINASAGSLPNGTYSDTVNFVNTTDHLGDTTRDVSLAVGVPTAVYEWPLDTSPGWSVEDQWARGQPAGGGGEYGGPDPTSGHTGSNVYGYNLNGDYPNNLPQRHLTSTAIDCTDLSQVTLRFWRWLGVEQPAYDHAYVRVSNNGSNWTTVWQNTSEITDSSWVLQEIDISAVADHQPTVYLRWTMGTTDGGWRYCGWNIDDIQIVALAESDETCDDGIQNQGEDRIDCGGPCPPCDCLSDGACSDGQYCTGVETCDANGHCQPGSVVDCDDGVNCTTDSCNEGTDSCNNVPNNAVCDNGLYCDGTETCHPVAGCQAGTAVDCDDGVACTADSCNENTDACDNLPNDALCDNGLYCDGAETCDPVAGCQAGTAVDCDDGVTCTADSCNEGTDSCDNLPNDALCDNGLYCDGTETCDPVAGCQAGTAVDCDDGVNCTADSCNEGTDSCDNLPNDALCDNGLYCDGTETCDSVAGCQSGDYPCEPAEWCDEDDGVCRVPCEALAARSCVDHYAAGVLCIELGLSGGIEPRLGGVTTLDIDLLDASGFGGEVSVVCVDSGDVSGSVSGTSVDGQTVTVTFALALPDEDACTVELDCGAAVCVRGLAGDIDGGGLVTPGDASIIKPHFGDTPGGATARYDVDHSGLVTPGDFSQVKPRFTHAAQACP